MIDVFILTKERRGFSDKGIQYIINVVKQIYPVQTEEINIKMRPLAGFIYLRIPLGFGNPVKIAYGQMELESEDSLYTYLMEIVDSDGVFHTDFE